MENVKALIDPVTYADIILAAEICPVEISGLAKVTREENSFTIFGEPFIPKQKCRSDASETVFDTADYGRWCEKMIIAGRDEELKKFKLWWHSHARSSVYFSGTDESTITRIGSFYAEWWMHLVVNKQRHTLLRLDVYKPERCLPVYIPRAKFSSIVTKDAMEKLIAERRERMTGIINSNITIVNTSGNYGDDGVY